jgi:transposase
MYPIFIMKRAITVRPLTNTERGHLEVGLRSPDAFILRRCQIILASSMGEGPQMATSLGCDDQTVRNVNKAFNQRGLDRLTRGSSCPHTTQAAFDSEGVSRLQELLHHRGVEKSTSLWTLDLAAEVSFQQGVTSARVSSETVRSTLAGVGIRWQRAKHWINSPDSQYARKSRRDRLIRHHYLFINVGVLS